MRTCGRARSSRCAGIKRLSGKRRSREHAIGALPGSAAGRKGGEVYYDTVRESHCLARKTKSVSGTEGAMLAIASQGDSTLEEAVARVVSETGSSRIEVMRMISKLRSEGKIELKGAATYEGFGSFAFSPYSLWFWGVVATTAASFLTLLVTSGILVYARYVLGSLFILFLPGFSLVELLFARPHTHFIWKGELDALERLALSVGLSLALVPLTGLALNYTPWGIRLLPIALSLGSLTIIFSVSALWRKHKYYRLARMEFSGDSNSSSGSPQRPGSGSRTPRSER